MLRKESREPNFDNFILLLKGKPTPRPVLFDFIIGNQKIKMLVGDENYNDTTELEYIKTRVKAFDYAGYDFTPILVKGLEFPRKGHHQVDVQTKSLNEGSMITDQTSFNSYIWPEVKNCDFSIIKEAGKFLPYKMKFIPYAYDGILENAIGIVGYENLCYLIYDDPDLVKRIFFEIGRRIEEFYYKVLEYNEVQVIMCNDDWGFNSQTMFSPSFLRENVFPYYQRIVEKAHKLGKFAILHSCGYFNDIIDDILNKMKFDGKHSFEDKICPVEKAYDDLHEEITILGGIDLDFLVRATENEVYNRAKKLLERTKDNGKYALGTGNSVPDFVPNENYIALMKAGLEE